MNAPVDHLIGARDLATALEALRIAVRTLEARWPRHYNDECRRDTAVLQRVAEALKIIEGSTTAPAPAVQSKPATVVAEADLVRVRPDPAAQNVTLTVHPDERTAPPEARAFGLQLDAARAIYLGAMLQRAGEMVAKGGKA